MARFGDGLAIDADLSRAASLAARRALEPLGGRAPDLACVFISGSDPDAVAAAGEVAAGTTGAANVIGCSAPGVLGSDGAVESASAVSVWCALLPDVRIRAFHLEVMPAEAGMAVVGMPERQPDDVVAILLADPWSFPIDGFVERSNEALAGLPMVGGLASGLRGRGSTRLFLARDSPGPGPGGVFPRQRLARPWRSGRAARRAGRRAHPGQPGLPSGRPGDDGHRGRRQRDPRTGRRPRAAQAGSRPGEPRAR